MHEERLLKKTPNCFSVKINNYKKTFVYKIYSISL